MAEERARAAEDRAQRAAGGSNIDFENDSTRDIAEAIARGLVTPQRVRQLIHALDVAAKQLEKARRAVSVTPPNSPSVL